MTSRFLAASLAVVCCCLWWSISGADFLDWIFADSFESGNVLVWSWSFGVTSVIPDAASEGNFGLRVPAVLDVPGWVQDQSPDNEAVIHTDFDLRIDNLSMTRGDEFAIHVGWAIDNEWAAFVLSLVSEGGEIGLRLAARESSGGFINSPVIPLPGPGWHRIGVEYGAATGPSNTGEMRLFINGIQEAALSDFDNDGILVNSLRLGTMTDVDQGTSGSVDFDVYTSVRLFDPWPCSGASSSEPSDGSAVCLDGEGRSTAIAAGGCGDGVVVWQGSEDLGLDRSRLGGIYGRPVAGSVARFNPTFPITLDQFATMPAVGMDAACRSVVAWQTAFTAETIMVGVFDADGTTLTQHTPVSMGAVEEWPAVGVSDAGRFLVAWRRSPNDEQEIWGQFFEADATPVGSPFQVDPGIGPVSKPTVAMNGDGFAVVAWESSGAILGHLFEDSGASLGIVSLSPGSLDGEPAVAMMATGGSVATWTRGVTQRRIYLRRYDTDGTPLSAEIRVDSLTPADCTEPQVAVSADDKITVVWASLFEGQHTIRGRRFNADGEPAGGEFIVEQEGAVWFPTGPRVAAAERLLFSYSELAEFHLYTRGALVSAKNPALFSDGFESGDVGAWTTAVP